MNTETLIKHILYRLPMKEEYTSYDTAEQKPKTLQEWVTACLQRGYSAQQVYQYLIQYGYTPDQLQPVFYPQQAQGQQHIGQRQYDFNERLTPQNAKEYFTRLYSLLRYPQFFFSHLYVTDEMRGFRMLAFSMLLSLSLGLLFWFSYFYTNIFLYIPEFIKPLFSLYNTSRVFLFFALILIVFQPLYFFVIHRRRSDLTFKQQVTAMVFSLVPFVIFAAIPILNVLAVFMTMHLSHMAFSKFMHVDQRSWFYFTDIYVLGLAVIALGLALFYVAGGQTLIVPDCQLFPDGQCSVHQVDWNTLSLQGIDDTPITIYNNQEKQVCVSSSADYIECSQLIMSGGYYFSTPTMTGAFWIS